MDIKSAQAKGFGSDGGKQYTVENDIIPLKKRVLVSNMHFGETKVADAAGTILAHSIKEKGVSLKKGRLLSEDDCQQLG